ncbi:MAG: hypothetical protein LBR43_01180 [Spiroplasmataceae bacterium]|nr:hypothetical protein [Spiroplasmataceae bacterium]
MNCLNCYKLDWEISQEQEKQSNHLWKIVIGLSTALLLMLASWYLIGYFIIKRHQNIVQERKNYLHNHPQQIPQWEQLVRDRNLKLMEQMLEQEKSSMSPAEYEQKKQLLNKLKAQNEK